MRGKGAYMDETISIYRITPAYAGKSISWSKVVFVIKDHPRLCGEKNASDCGQAMRAGSPPPMRGKVHNPDKFGEINRITPAYAGKSYCEHSFDRSPEDHPRLCGEKIPLLHQKCSVLGSPPPMRGKAEAWKIGGYRSKDHPRLCGEKFHNFIFHKLFIGSPPPMRGKADSHAHRAAASWITPAYAGKRLKRS